MNGAHVLGRSGARLRPWVPRTLYQRGVPCAPPRLPSLPGSASLPVGAALRPCGWVRLARREQGAGSARDGGQMRCWNLCWRALEDLGKFFRALRTDEPAAGSHPPVGREDTPAAVVSWQGIHVYTCALSAVGGDAVRAMSVSVSVSV